VVGEEYGRDPGFQFYWLESNLTFYRRTNMLLGRSMEGILDSSSAGWSRSNMTLFYKRTNMLLERNMEGILDSSSAGWRRSNMACL
jgi:hypothetical protein